MYRDEILVSEVFRMIKCHAHHVYIYQLTHLLKYLSSRLKSSCPWNLEYLCDMPVQHLDRMQSYQKPTGVLLAVLHHEDGDATVGSVSVSGAGGLSLPITFNAEFQVLLIM